LIMAANLPLFDDLEPLARGGGALSAADPHQPADSRDEARRRGERHLVAARRLARTIARLPERSPEQTRTGLAICAHLKALLIEAEKASGESS
jgi:hypothetical protein